MRLIVSLLFFFTATAGADCIPKNNHYIGLEDARSAIGKAAFDDAIEKVQRAYEDEVGAQGAILKINNLWSDGTVNAQAYRRGRTWHVDAFGGLARYPGMTKNGFITVLCHELGHHLGRAPRYNLNTDWAATEGQADYFATVRCMKKLGISSSAPALALATVLADLGGERSPSRNRRDLSRVSRTYEAHPAAQCRLDTMDAGRSCRASGALSNSDPRPGTCHQYDASGSPIGSGNRPRCWYAP